MRDPDDLFRALGRSRFRSSFQLGAADAAFLNRRGLEVVLQHARRFIEDRLAPARLRADGRQTPWEGHPAFVAQHATATCCRSCLQKWHGIEKGRLLSPVEVDYTVQILHRWLKPMSTDSDGTAVSGPADARAVLHVDMDAFYASVEERENPELVGKPLIVGGTPDGRGVVAAANYVVRQFGVHSAMPTATALRLCPDAIVVRPRLDFYARISRQIREILFRYTPLVEPLSLDEAFLDVTGCRGLFGSPVEIGRQIKNEIWDETRLVASVGVAPNKFLAKIASDLEKPDGLVVVDAGKIQEFLDPLPVGRLWGVGKVTRGTLHRFGIETIGQLRRLSPRQLSEQFGHSGERFWRLTRGLDERPVVPDREAKSISHETTFATDLSDSEVLRAWLLELTEQVGQRLRTQKLHGRTVQLKVRFADFRTITRSRTLKQPTDSTSAIWQTAADLLMKVLADSRCGVRLLGIGLSELASPALVQRTLFDDETQQKSKDLDAVADAVRQRFGETSLNRGTGLMHNAHHRPVPRPDQSPPESI